MLEAAEWNIIGDAKRRVFTLCEINATERVEIKEKSAEPGLAEASRKIDTSGGGTITRVTQAVSGGRHDGFKYFRPEARAPACPAWNYRSCSLRAEIEPDVDVDVRLDSYPGKINFSPFILIFIYRFATDFWIFLSTHSKTSSHYSSYLLAIYFSKYIYTFLNFLLDSLKNSIRLF